jgi:uncharacterized glyoxalase superfamily protein PhnB
VVPSLTVRDTGAALDFYQRAFGFTKKMAMNGPDGRIMHAEVAWQDIVIMLSPESSPGQTCKAPISAGIQQMPMNLYVYCEDVDALFARATAAGAKVVVPPNDAFWGDRFCQVVDPDGYAWCFATNKADFDPSKVPH